MQQNLQRTLDGNKCPPQPPLHFWCVCAFPGHDSVDDMLDTENKRLAENLATKVSRLKSVSHNRQTPITRFTVFTGASSRRMLSQHLPWHHVGVQKLTHIDGGEALPSMPLVGVTFMAATSGSAE